MGLPMRALRIMKRQPRNYKKRYQTQLSPAINGKQRCNKVTKCIKRQPRNYKKRLRKDAQGLKDRLIRILMTTKSFNSKWQRINSKWQRLKTNWQRDWQRLVSTII